MAKQDISVLPPSDKPNVVLVHGFRGSPLGLEEVAKDLRKAGYSVYLPAIPPFAGAGELEHYDPKDYADYLAQYIREQGLKRPILIGHSMGSIIVAATTKYHPERVHPKLVLLSPISVKTAKPFAIISPLAAIVPRPIVNYVTTRFLFVPKDKKLFQDTLALTRKCSEDQPPSRSAIAAATKFSTNYSIQDFLPNKDTLIIAGAKDRLIPQAKTRELAEQIQATLKFIPDSGHLHNYEKPHETASLILEFLES